jgi:hypothetical protein
MPVILKNLKRGARAGQLASEPTAVAKTAAGPIEADQHTDPMVKDPDPDQRAIATRIKAELSRDANSRGELKSRRRELRLSPSADDLIRCAMEVSGLTAGDLAYQGALKLLEDHYRGLQVRRQRQRDRDRASRFRR